MLETTPTLASRVSYKFKDIIEKDIRFAQYDNVSKLVEVYTFDLK